MVGELADVLDDVVGLHEWPVFFIGQIQCNVQEVNDSFVGINGDFQTMISEYFTDFLLFLF